MDQDADYFGPAYADDKAELRRSLSSIASVLPLFVDKFDTRIDGWPYRIEQSASRNHRAEFSSSTNAMIAFAMLGASDALTGSVLLPLSRPVPIKQIASHDTTLSLLRESADHVVRKLVRRLSVRGLPAFQSGTFGNDDPFTLTWVLESLAARGPSLYGSSRRAARPVRNALRIARRVITGLKRSGDANVLRFDSDPKRTSRPVVGAYGIPHPFPLLRVAHLARVVDKLTSVRVGVDLGWMQAFFEERLHLNLAANTIPDSAFDAADLVFSLEGLLLIDQTPDEGRLETVFRVIGESQDRNPYWRPLRPFIATPQGFALLPLSIEVANSLLRICQRLRTEFAERSFFQENLSLFKRYAQWLRSRLVHIRQRSQEYAGWHSEHVLSAATIDLWETSQVVLFLLLYSDLLQQHIAALCLKSTGLTREPQQTEERHPLDVWKRESREKEPLQGSNLPRTPRVYDQLLRRYVAPRSRDPQRPTGAKFSILLYGPPGTGKTGIARDLARALGQPLIQITPSDFIAGGPSAVEAKAKVIFTALGEQADCVIVFDEIDRLILDRDSGFYHKQSDVFQFMTPSMLVKLKNLRDAEHSIFIVATNYYERIDGAAKRTGRIDDRLLVLPPDAARRQSILRALALKQFTQSGMTEPQSRSLIKRLSLGGVAREWRLLIAQTVFYTYGELKTVVEAAFDDLQSFEPLGVVQEIRASTARTDPAVRLANYWNRFPPGDGLNRDDFMSAQDPLEEFLGLLELLEEVGRLREALPRGLQILIQISKQVGARDDLRSATQRLLRRLRRGAS